MGKKVRKRKKRRESKRVTEKRKDIKNEKTSAMRWRINLSFHALYLIFYTLHAILHPSIISAISLHCTPSVSTYLNTFLHSLHFTSSSFSSSNTTKLSPHVLLIWPLLPLPPSSSPCFSLHVSLTLCHLSLSFSHYLISPSSSELSTGQIEGVDR